MSIVLMRWACAFALVLGTAGAFAQDFSAAPVRIVVGFAPGGASDAVGRLIAQKLGPLLNAKTVVENRDGANSNIAADLVAKARPDGYTLLFNTPSNILSAAFGEKLSYDVLEDLTPVMLVGTGPQILVTHPSLPVKTTREFITLMRAHPDKLAYGSGGTGSITHLAPLLFLQVTGLTALHVPYKGAGPALVDLVGGRVHFAMPGMGTVVPMVNDRRLRPLGVGSPKRASALPDVPTLSETIPGFEVGTWYGLMSPAKTPPAIVRAINAAMVKALQDPELRTRLARYDVEPRGSTPEEYAAFLRSELERWTKVIRSAGLKLE